jgi:hypothetical protein
MPVLSEIQKRSGRFENICYTYRKSVSEFSVLRNVQTGAEAQTASYTISTGHYVFKGKAAEA